MSKDQETDSNNTLSQDVSQRQANYYSNASKKTQTAKLMSGAVEAGKGMAGKPPLFMDYCFWENRLKSYTSTYSSRTKCQHSPAELAFAGFFNTGVGDCVRCFYCGLGLKVWKSDDNVYVEHQRYRPNCGFLKAITASTNQPNYELLVNDIRPVFGGSLSLSSADKHALLERENKYYKQRMLCRMCFRNPTRELLYPCAHLVICQACSKITEKCPSCRKQILATSSVFLS